jgi:hypothetical protein
MLQRSRYAFDEGQIEKHLHRSGLILVSAIHEGAEFPVGLVKCRT